MLCVCVAGAVGVSTSSLTTSKPHSLTTTTTTTTHSSTTTTVLFYGEVWFTVVVCVAAVVLLILITLIIIKCCCRRQGPLVRQRIPLDQSVKTSPPSYRYHDYHHRDNNYQTLSFDKLRVRMSMICRQVYVAVIRS